MRTRALAVPFLLPVIASAALAQQTRTVTGTVTNAATNQPIDGITVSAVGTQAGGVTDAQGRFRIVIPAGEQTLAARGIGYKRVTQRVPAGVASVSFRLERDVLQLDQVTVTGQTTTLSTRNATTAVSVVNAEEVTRAPAQSLEQALQGKVLGAKIDMNSGAPGGGAQIQIRGVTSVLGNGQPLVVVDGVIISNDGFSSGANTISGAAGAAGGSGQDAIVNRLADINPNEIESLEILKSAAATALYGSRATNGVVVIRTKRGTNGQSRFNFSQRVGTQAPLRSLGQRTFTSVDQVVDLPYGNGESGEDYLNQAFPGGTIPASANRSLEDEFYSRRTPSYQTNGSVTAGNDRTSLFASGTLQRENGLAPSTGAQLMAGRFNVDQTITPRLRASVNANVTRNLLRRGISNNDNTGTSPIYNFAYTPSLIDLNQRDASGLYVRNPFGGGGNATSNPFETFNSVRLDETVWRSVGGLTLSYNAYETPKNRVSLQSQFGFDRFQQDGDVYSPGFVQYEGNDGFVGRATQTNVNSQNYNYNFNVTHAFTPGRLASFTTTVGGGYEQQGFDLSRYRARGLLPGVTRPQLGGSPNLTAEGNRELFRDQNVTLTEQVLAFGERLALTGGVRFDRSSTYGDREKWWAWPRLAGSYRLDTPFVPSLDNVKLRASFGRTGNRPRFTDRFVLFGAGGAIGGQTSLVSPATVNNPNIEPERLTEVEVGTDLAFFKQRATVEFSFYDRTVRDLLFTAPLAASSGFAQRVLNTGRLGNRGFELGLGAVPLQGRNVTWTSRVNITRNRQVVDQLPLQIPRFNVPGSFGAAFGRNALVTGLQTTSIFGSVPYTTRLNDKGLRVPDQPLPVGYFATDAKFLAGNAVNGVDFVVVDTVLGNSNPRLLTNFNNTVSYRRFALNFTVDWRLGGDVANMTHLLYDEGGNSRDYDNASPVAGVPLGEWRYNAWNGGNDTRMYVESGTNLRLRDVALSYDAPESFARFTRARSMRLTLQGRNLLMRSRYWGYDPEFNNFGNTNLNRFIDLAPYPGVRQFSLAVDLGF